MLQEDEGKGPRVQIPIETRRSVVVHAQQFETGPTNSRNRSKLMGPAGYWSLGVTPMWNTHPTLEVTLGLAMNLALVLLFAAYPAQWLGLW